MKTPPIVIQVEVSRIIDASYGLISYAETKLHDTESLSWKIGATARDEMFKTGEIISSYGASSATYPVALMEWCGLSVKVCDDLPPGSIELFSSENGCIGTARIADHGIPA